MVVSVAATPLVVVPALGVLAIFLHDVPYVGLATGFVPWLCWLMVAALLGGALAFTRLRRSRFAGGLTVLAVLVLVGGSIITVRMTAAVERAGADINPIELFGIGAPKSQTPDAEATYATFEGDPVRLSIYRPPGSTPNSNAPVLVYIHGGGWVAGDRHDHSADSRWFADQGWLTVSIDYPLSSDGRHLWDVTHDQVGCALAWVGENARTYGGDPDRLSLTGDSAGGNLAINAAYQAAAGTLQSSCGGRVPAARAVSVLYPAVDPAGVYGNKDPVMGSSLRASVRAYTGGSPEQFPERYARVTSDTYISAAAPPTLIILPEADHSVPTAGTYRFAQRASAAGVEVKLITVPYADHGFDTPPGSIGQQAFRQLTARWLRDHGQAP